MEKLLFFFKIDHLQFGGMKAIWATSEDEARKCLSECENDAELLGRPYATWELENIETPSALAGFIHSA